MCSIALDVPKSILASRTAAFGDSDSQRCPEPIDVHDPKRLMGHVCFNPQTIEANEVVKTWGLIDLFRKHVSDPGQYTTYDYRTVDGVAEGKGWRVDHILATRPLADRSIHGGAVRKRARSVTGDATRRPTDWSIEAGIDLEYCRASSGWIAR